LGTKRLVPGFVVSWVKLWDVNFNAEITEFTEDVACDAACKRKASFIICFAGLRLIRCGRLSVDWGME
jgi:hypothetical protein